ncbi:MAG: ABC transporter ATP-binding protein/permease [Desulfovibrio sp.]|jgi:ABC-type multidrug transport system fused ATPase/permease subunit|nr:ABC transporter ATP-binding protein/permease [Desulfovibrio sp.]
MNSSSSFSSFGAFRKIFSRIPKRLRRAFWYSVAASLCMGFAELLLASVISLLGVALAVPASLLATRPAQALLTFIPSLQDQRFLVTCLAGMIIVAVIAKQALNALLVWCQEYVAQRVSMVFFEQVFSGYLHAPYLWFAMQEIPRLSTRLGWTAQAGTFLGFSLLFITQVSIGVILLTAVFLVSPVVELIIFGSLGLAVALSYPHLRRKVTELNVALSNVDARIARFLHMSLLGMREVHIYRQQTALESTANAELWEKTRTRAWLQVMAPLPGGILEFFGVTTLFGAVCYMNWAGVSLAVFTGTLALLAGVAWRLMPTAGRLMSALMGMQGTMAYLKPALEVLEEAEAFARTEPAAEIPEFRDMLRLEDVSFRYPGISGERPDTLRHISLKIPRGSMVGLIGPSGAGKTTIVGLLAGLFFPSAGGIFLDGKPMTEASLNAWRGRIGYVPQSPFLLNASILENVAFCHWGKKIDRDLVLACCRRAAMDYLDDLPKGMDTVIGERGALLSGGQAQRVAIARALYSDPQMLLFDEATSALDGAAEQAIQQTIDSLRENMTVVVIAHRLTTVENCDYIYWIENGQVKKEGSPVDVLPEYEQRMRISAGRMNE